jgi:hypothetical protein
MSGRKTSPFQILIGCIGADYEVTKMGVLKFGEKSSGHSLGGNPATCYPSGS